MLEAAISASEDAARISAFTATPVASQTPAPVVAAPSQLPIVNGGDVSGGATLEATPGAAVPAAGESLVDPAAHMQAPGGSGAVMAAPATGMAVQPAASAAQAIVLLNAIPGEADAAVEEHAADGVSLADANGATPQTFASPAAPAAVMPTLGSADRGDGATSASPVSPQPSVPATPGEAPHAGSPKGEARDQAQPAPASAQPAAQAQPKASPAPAADAAPQATSVSQPAMPAQAAIDALTASAGPTGPSRPAAAPPALQSAPAATIQVYTRIIERADGRAQRFEVRLDPAELGRVDVRIEIGADRKVHAVLAAHDSAALTDLMKGQRALERALADAGIDLADKGVRFELASDNGRGGGQARDGDNARTPSQNVWRSFGAASVAVSAEAADAASPPAWRMQRLDLVA